MTKMENRLLRAIKTNPGISWQQLAARLVKRESALKKALTNLHIWGYIGFRKSGCYPCCQIISVYKKGVDEYVRTQRQAGVELSNADVEVAEMQLQNHLTPRQLSKYIPCVPGDEYYIYAYGIDTSSAALFEKTNGFHFDFEQFEYILTQWME